MFREIHLPIIGSPMDRGVAAARTNNHLGVITAVPKKMSLGLIR
jgi:hypothetical protein